MKMNVLLIIAGAVLIVVGVVRMAGDKQASADSAAQSNTEVALAQQQPQVQVVERVIERVVQVPAEAPSKSADSLTAKEKRNGFEDFVANLFKDRSTFTVLEWNQGQTSSEGVYAENDKNPDFKIEHNIGSPHL